MKRSTAKSPQTPGAEVRKVRWQRWLVIGSAVAAVFVVAGLIGSVVRAHKETQLALPSGAAGASGLAIPVVGKSPVTLTVYEDMRDPASETFETTYGPTLDKLVHAGLVTVNYREVADVDAKQGGSGSLQAGNALGCAANAKKFAEYRAELLRNQPAESDDAFASTGTLISLAKKVKGLDSDVFRACVNNGDFKVWVKTSTSQFDAAQFGAVPVLQMHGSNVKQSPTPSPSPSASAGGDAAQGTVLISATQTLTPAQLLAKVYVAATGITPTAKPVAKVPAGALPSASTGAHKASTRGGKKPAATGSAAATPTS
ncbi:DsbA family protein [Streptacidiphilus rugosus]|uniref:DsbA family protein n=1 Tax=Streptacidiphilus rugosus TaxID=405783 RepID=UPI000AC847B1|nr:thioredoxin domain-containing protein [Streptacidiphilus rugosus]